MSPYTSTDSRPIAAMNTAPASSASTAAAIGAAATSSQRRGSFVAKAIGGGAGVTGAGAESLIVIARPAAGRAAPSCSSPSVRSSVAFGRVSWTKRPSYIT
jgi:hypothetical protein